MKKKSEKDEMRKKLQSRKKKIVSVYPHSQNDVCNQII